MDKGSLRRELFARIRNLPQGVRAAHSAAIRALAAEDPGFRNAATVFTYLALPGEPDLNPLLADFPEKRWCVPRVVAGGLAFHRIARIDEAVPGVLGILHPDPARHAAVASDEAECVFVPGVGFDPTTRARIGRGKGLYDRFLAQALAAASRPRLVGVLFSVQLAEVPAEAHDIPMDRLLAETGWL